MKIGGVVPFSASDYPGVPSMVVFTPGCNYDCWFCYNRKTLLGEGVNLIDDTEVLKMLEVRKKMLEGVVISGGECTLQPDLAEFIQKVKDMGYKVKVDTNGSNPVVVKQLIELGVDYFAVDYKCKFTDYPSICNYSASNLISTLYVLEKSNVDWELRTTLIPDITKNKLMHMANDLPFEVKKWVLKKFVKDQLDEKVCEDHMTDNPAYVCVNKLINYIKELQPNTVVNL